MEKSDTILEIWTDGACKTNPGIGGWGALMRWKGVEKELFGGEYSTTNNRMEMLAVIKALEAVNRPVEIRVTTDSQYVMNGITKWIKKWKKNGWKTGGSPVKNKDLWVKLDELVSKYHVEWEWVRGHTGHPENTRADQLANRGANACKYNKYKK